MAGKNEPHKSLIVGSSSRISLWISQALKKENITPITISRSSLNADYVIKSYQDYIEVFQLINRVYKEHGVFNSVYYCPGSYSEEPISKVNYKNWTYDIELILFGAFAIYKALENNTLISMHSTKIIYIGSTASVSKPANFSSYSIGKASLELLNSYINNEGSRHIRSCYLRLGTCQTDFSRSRTKENVIKKEDLFKCINHLENSALHVFPDLISIRPIRSEQ